ncbi:MAG: hypothetical protein JRI34_00825 [Deltaproteobacteria bacterium]|nr:hypothetical protein [Deltaproteobacteria bacterium]
MKKINKVLCMGVKDELGWKTKKLTRAGWGVSYLYTRPHSGGCREHSYVAGSSGSGWNLPAAILVALAWRINGAQNVKIRKNYKEDWEG